MITPSMLPFIRAEIARQQTTMASNAECDRNDKSLRVIRERFNVPWDMTAHDRRIPRAVREATWGFRRSKLVTVAADQHAANDRQTRLHNAFRGKRPDLVCVFAKPPANLPIPSGSVAGLILMWLPPAEVAMARLAGWEVHPG